MGETAFGIIELLLVFGFALALGLWELYSLRRDRRRRQQQDRGGKG